MYDKHFGFVTPMAAMTPDLQSPRLNRRRRVRHRVHTPAYASFTGMSKGLVLDLSEILDISEDGASVQCPSALELNRDYALCLDLTDLYNRSGDVVGSLRTRGSPFCPSAGVVLTPIAGLALRQCHGLGGER